MISRERIRSEMGKIVDAKIAALKKSIDAAEESRDTATKSSAGDKHETARAMLQSEIDNLQSQLNRVMRSRQLIGAIPFTRDSKGIGPGSLVKTGSGIFFISVSLGKIDIEGHSIFCISTASPMGQALLGKKTGDIIEFRSKKIEILAVW